MLEIDIYTSMHVRILSDTNNSLPTSKTDLAPASGPELKNPTAGTSLTSRQRACRSAALSRPDCGWKSLVTRSS